jgi:hypothetical protein
MKVHLLAQLWTDVPTPSVVASNAPDSMSEALTSRHPCRLAR